MRTKQPRETVFFNGIEYARFPESRSPSRRRYFYQYPKGRALHQAVWESANGPIPDGYEIHHKDRDPGNNAIENLECLTHAEHRKRHTGDPISPARRAQIDRIRPLASAWHGSEEGIEWHRKNGRDAWKNRVSETRVCATCQCEYQNMALRDTDRFCSRKCAQKWRYHNAPIISKASCGCCGKEFMRRLGTKTRCCSLSCSAKLRVRDKVTGRLLGASS